LFTSISGGRRSGRERKAIARPSVWGAAVALVRAVGSHPREPESATRAVPAVVASRKLRRVILPLRLPLLDRLPKFVLSSLASVERE
jgi:hypothetical protein